MLFPISKDTNTKQYILRFWSVNRNFWLVCRHVTRWYRIFPVNRPWSPCEILNSHWGSTVGRSFVPEVTTSEHHDLRRLLMYSKLLGLRMFSWCRGCHCGTQVRPLGDLSPGSIGQTSEDWMSLTLYYVNTATTYKSTSFYFCIYLNTTKFGDSNTVKQYVRIFCLRLV